MSVALLEKMQDAQHALISALDAGDRDDIQIATHKLQQATLALQALGGIHAREESAEALESMRKTNRAAALRLRYLRDHTERQLLVLAGDRQGLTYQPGG